MKKGRKKVTVSITLDRELVEPAKKVLEDTGIKLSTFVNVILKSLIESETKPMKEVYGGITETLLEEAIKRKKKREGS